MCVYIYKQYLTEMKFVEFVKDLATGTRVVNRRAAQKCILMNPCSHWLVYGVTPLRDAQRFLRLLVQHNQEIAQLSPDPLRVGSGHKTKQRKQPLLRLSENTYMPNIQGCISGMEWSMSLKIV